MIESLSADDGHSASDPQPADTPMWLSHHWPSGYDRCALVSGRHVCRRCLFMYPVAAVAAVLGAMGVGWPDRFDLWALWLLPLPAVVDFVVDNLGRSRYSATRQAALSAVGAVAAGVGYRRYLESPGDWRVWSVVLAYGAICLAAALMGNRRAA